MKKGDIKKKTYLKTMENNLKVLQEVTRVLLENKLNKMVRE